ncbi:MAG: ABC transporter substrate-binding protein [Acidobacteriia bacterium]|nr:ABC transporter substrate-binding protein [Terriglobia bacterium]
MSWIRRTGAVALAASILQTALLAADAAPQHGGTLRVVQRAEPKTFNPVVALDAPSRDILRRIHADLISIDRQTQTTVPALAESWTRSKDGRTYRLKLRKEVRFSDGAPFTAADVVFSFAVYLDEKIKSPQRDLLLIDDRPIECRAIDAWTVEFRLPQPYAAAERLFDSVALLPKHRLENAWRQGNLQDAWSLSTPPEEIAGLGPFRLKSYSPGERVVLERNPYYWKKSLPNLDAIEFRFLPDEDVQLARFVAGDVDILNRVNPKSARYLQSKGASLADLGPGLEYNFLCFNLSPNSSKRAWFENRDFRQALSLAVDREAMARIIFQSRAAPIWGHVSPGNKLWYFAQLPRTPRNVPAARELLKRAGFAGKPMDFSILVSASSAERVQMATMLQSDWKEIGISVNIVTLEFRAMLDRVLNTRQFDTCILGLGGGDADPNPEMNVWLSSGAMHLWNPNQPHPATPWEAELDSLMHRQMVTLDYAARKQAYDRVQQIVAEQAPMIFLVSPHVVVAQRGNVGNFRPAILDHQTLWNADELYLKTAGPVQ